MEPFKSIKLPGGGGGGRAGVFRLATIFFLSLSGPEYFFPIYYEPEFFSQVIVGQNIIFYAMQIRKQLCSWAVNQLQHYCTEVVCLCVCPSAMTLTWHANSKYIVMQLDMRWIPPKISWYWNLTLPVQLFSAKRRSVSHQNCQWLDKHPNCIRGNTFCIIKFFEVQYLHK